MKTKSAGRLFKTRRTAEIPGALISQTTWQLFGQNCALSIAILAMQKLSPKHLFQANSGRLLVGVGDWFSHNMTLTLTTHLTANLSTPLMQGFIQRQNRKTCEPSAFMVFIHVVRNWHLTLASTFGQHHRFTLAYNLLLETLRNISTEPYRTHFSAVKSVVFPNA